MVTKDIINRYLVPLPQVIALFSFIYPEAYLGRLNQIFGVQSNKMMEYKHIKRIKIYQYYI